MPTRPVRSAPVRPPPVAPPPPEPLYVFLKPEIDQGLVTVLGDRSMPIVRIRNKGMFASGSAVVTILRPPPGPGVSAEYSYAPMSGPASFVRETLRQSRAGALLAEAGNALSVSGVMLCCAVVLVLCCSCCVVLSVQFVVVIVCSRC